MTPLSSETKQRMLDQIVSMLKFTKVRLAFLFLSSYVLTEKNLLGQIHDFSLYYGSAFQTPESEKAALSLKQFLHSVEQPSA